MYSRLRSSRNDDHETETPLGSPITWIQRFHNHRDSPMMMKQRGHHCYPDSDAFVPISWCVCVFGLGDVQSAVLQRLPKVVSVDQLAD